MFKVNNKDSGVFIVNFKHISHLILMFLLLTLNMLLSAGIMEYKEFNWLGKHMKKVRSSQAAVLVLNWHSFSLRVSLIKEAELKQMLLIPVIWVISFSTLTSTVSTTTSPKTRSSKYSTRLL